MNTNTKNSSAKALIKSALARSANEDRYLRRWNSNPLLRELGKLPVEIDKIICDQKPNFCHSLAFRMATYSDNSDNLFKRWNTLLENAKKADGVGDYARLPTNHRSPEVHHPQTTILFLVLG